MAFTHAKELLDAVKSNAEKRCFLYFIASPDETGQSWCPDCRKAQPVVDEVKKFIPENAKWFDAYTGDRPTWRNPENEFRVNSELRVDKVPTLFEFGKEKRLVEKELLDKDTILELFQ